MKKINIEIKLNKDYTHTAVDGMQLAEFEIEINNIEIPHYFKCIVFTPNDKVSEDRIITYIVISSIQNAKYTDYFYQELKSLNLTEEEKEFVDNYTDIEHKLEQASDIVEKYFNVSAIDNLATIKRITKWAAQ